jgi:hypothetical protein
VCRCEPYRSLRFSHANHHTLVTELSESGAGDKVIMSIAGHVSRAMLSRYSHVRMDAKRRALDEIAARQNTADEKRKGDAERQARSSGGPCLSPVVQ